MLVFTQAALSFALPCAASSEAAALRRAASPKLASELPNPANTDPACALAVWFREPLARVRSHYGYFKYKKHRNLTSLADLYKRGTPPHWVLSSTACHAPTSHESQLPWSHVKRSTLVTKPDASGGLACSETTRAST